MGVGVRCIVAAAAVISLTSAWPSRAYDRELLDELRIARRNLCVVASGKCFSTGQCCSDLVCASFDDYYGQKPEVPGKCVKEKDLQPCVTSADCYGSTKCMALGRSSERYCLPRQEDKYLKPVKTNEFTGEGVGGLGDSCQSDSDCRQFVGDDKLCCQDVRQGRQGTKRKCDRVTGISVCLGA